MPDFVIERLCEHQTYGSFDAQVPRADYKDLLGWYVREFVRGAFGMVTFVAVDGQREILAYITIAKFVIIDEDGEREAIILPAFAISVPYRRSRIGGELIDRAKRWLKEQNPDDRPYEGIVAWKGMSPSFDKYLQRKGFLDAPWNPDVFFWLPRESS